MNVTLVWLLAYVLPALVAGTLAKLLPQWRVMPTSDSIIVHSALIVSIFGSQIAIRAAGLTFPWGISVPSILWYILAILLTTRTSGPFAIWYALSALIQQLTMLSIAFLLLTAYPLWSVIIFIVPFFVLCHDMRGKLWRIRILLLSIWGASSILLFSIFPNVLVIAALHTVLGACLISYGIVYTRIASEDEAL